MECFKKEANSPFAAAGKDDSRKPLKIFLNLKNKKILQQVMIETMLKKLNYNLEDLALLLGVGMEKLQKTRNGESKLPEGKAIRLINLFYLSTR